MADGGETDRWCTARWNELNAHRARIATANKLEYRALAVFDDGRKELGMRMRDGYSRADVEHVIRVLVAEAEDRRSLRWLDGGMFTKRRFDNALARSLGDAKSTATPSRQTDGEQRAPGPVRDSDDPVFRGPRPDYTKRLTAEERAAKLAAMGAGEKGAPS